VLVQKPTRRRITDTSQTANPARNMVGEASHGVSRKVRKYGALPSFASGTSQIPIANERAVSAQPNMIEPSPAHFFLSTKISSTLPKIQGTSGASQAWSIVKPVSAFPLIQGVFLSNHARSIAIKMVVTIHPAMIQTNLGELIFLRAKIRN